MCLYHIYCVIHSHVQHLVYITFIVSFTHTHMFNIYFASLLHRARLEKEKDLESEGPQMCPWAKTAWKTVRVHTLPFLCVHVKMMDNICGSNSENDWQYLYFKFWKWLTVFAVQILTDDSGRLVLFPLCTDCKMCVWLQRFGGRENVWLEVGVLSTFFCHCHRFWSSSWLVQRHRLWNSDEYAQ